MSDRQDKPRKDDRVTAFSDAELFRFRDGCECEAIYRRRRDDDEGDALWYLIRNIVSLMELERLLDDERDRIRPPKSRKAAVREEWEARRQPVKRTEEPAVAEAIRKLRRDLEDWTRIEDAP